VQFYDDDNYLIDDLSLFIGATLVAGDSAVVIATPEHREMLAARISASGLDLRRVVRQGRFFSLDARQTLETFLDGDMPDPTRFAEVVGAIIRQAASAATSSNAPVAAFGEMVALLWEDGLPEAAITLEQLWNELARTHHFTLHCAYPMRLFPREKDREPMERVCHEHSHVRPTEAYTGLVDGENQLRSIALLQQQARALESEIEMRRQVNAVLEQREIELREALATRDLFFSVAAHELKTPLTGLKLSAQMVLRFLQDGTLEPDRLRSLMQRLDSQTDKLSHLVSQLLDVSRLQRGRIDLEPTDTDLAALVRAYVETFGSLSETHELRLSIPDEVRAVIDPGRFEQVLSNLVENAVKYGSPEGPVEVDLRPMPNGMIRLSVRDYGEGICEEAATRVFEPFFRADPMNQPAGLGLGLHISRQIVDMHSGQIWVETPADGGCRFVAEFPQNGPLSEVAESSSC